MVIDSSFIPANLLLMYSVYLVGTASPGPSNMTIMAVAIQRGRTPALALASGVITGSIAWGLLAGFGLATALSTWGNILVALKVAGGLYLLWLAYSAGRSALKSNGKSKKYADSLGVSNRQLYLRGAAMHLGGRSGRKGCGLWPGFAAARHAPGRYERPGTGRRAGQ